MNIIKSNTQLKQAAMQLLKLEEIRDGLQYDSPPQHTMNDAIAQIFTANVPNPQFETFMTYYNEYKQLRADHRNEMEVWESQ